METVGPLSCGFIYVGLLERSRTDYQASNISAYISFNHFKLNHKFMCPPHRSAPTPKLVSSLVFPVSVKSVSIHSHLSQKSWCCLVASVFPILSHGAGVASYQVPIPPLSHCSQTAPRFPLGNCTPTLYLLCDLGSIYPVPCQLWP